MTGPTCDACSKPVADQARLCGRCSELLARDLGDVRALVDELEVSRTRQSRAGKSATGLVHRSEDRPLPWDERASEVIEILRSTLVGWVRVVCEERAVDTPTDRLEAMAAFLMRHHEWLRHHAAAAEFADEIEHVVRLCRRAIDSRLQKDLTWIGPCRGEHEESEERGAFCCLAEVYAEIGSEAVACPACGSPHDVSARQAWLLDEARDQLASAQVIAPALTRMGWRLSDSTIRSWVARGRLSAHGLDHRGNQTFRVGDVLDLLEAEAVRQAERAAKQGDAGAKSRRREAC